MTDIVDELRSEHGQECGNCCGTFTGADLMEAAADEIEKLRAYNARLVVDMCKAADEIERLTAWQAEALYVMDCWDGVWELVPHGPIGTFRWDAVQTEIEKLRREVALLLKTIRADAVGIMERHA